MSKERLVFLVFILAIIAAFCAIGLLCHAWTRPPWAFSEARAVEDATFGLDGDVVAFSTWDGRLQIWRPETGSLRELAQFAHTDYVRPILPVLDSDHIVVRLLRNEGMYLQMVSLQSGGTIGLPHKSHTSTPWILSPVGDWLCGAGPGGPLVLIDSTTMQAKEIVKAGSGYLEEPAFLPDGTGLVVTALGDVNRQSSLAGILSVPDGYIRQLFGVGEQLPRTWHNRPFLSSSGRYLALQYRNDSQIGIWRTVDASLVSVIGRYWEGQEGVDYEPGAIRGVAFSPDELTVLTTASCESSRLQPYRPVWPRLTREEEERLKSRGSECGGRLWNVATGELLMRLTGHEGPVTGGVYFEDGSRILTWGDDGTARIWNPVNGACLSVLRPKNGKLEEAWLLRGGRTMVFRIPDLGKTSEILEVWKRQRPEFWWGAVVTWPFWAGTVCMGFSGVVIGFAFRRYLRERSRRRIELMSA